ncbi:alpha/beta fold hydrolase [Paenibacillus allorhizosphaerae]|uniref:AB hydrolase-1 domain-containing protein n=1 Tax=Paenibacillus allorhizosphaerae TaxID=2849866 RepID=A0ABM8VT55_9BACL|nr:alpha/beta fold hydrolase [Paenibacillus allorhizosphaerae]CAG7657416.1 hypothetical protein PAECIP111802_06719 [Paenibacillus allorhizosphaerae]
MNEQNKEINGGMIAYSDQGEGVPVVLLHGFCGSSAYWDEVVPLLAQGCRVIVPDLRGHGGSSARAEQQYSMDDFADDTAALLDALDTGRVVLLGHSLGGYATLAFAEKYPDKLLGFGLIHSTAFPDDEKGKEGRLKSQQTIKQQGLPTFLDGLIPKLFAPAHVETMPEAVRKAKDIGLGTNPEGAVATLEGMRTRPDRNHVLSAAAVPVLLVAGTADQIIPLERAFSVSGERIEQKRIDGAGHMSMMEAPGELTKIILDFIGRL